MKKSLRVSYVTCLMLFVMAGSALAIDAGLPALPKGLKNTGFEIFYENFRRDIKQEVPYYSDFRIANDSDRVVAESLEQEETRIIGRFNFGPTPKILMHVDLGAAKSSPADYTPLFGAGISYKAWESEIVDLNVFASGHYITGTKYEDEFSITTEEGGIRWEWPEGTQTESYYEIAGGATVSRDILIVPNVTLLPYAGFQLSKLEGDEKYDHTFVEVRNHERVELDGYIRNEGVFSLVAGAGGFLGNGLGLRLEGRFVNQTSISIGLSYNF